MDREMDRQTDESDFAGRCPTNVERPTKVNQWTDTSSVIEWISNSESKGRLSFMVLDIESLYPLISQNLLIKVGLTPFKKKKMYNLLHLRPFKNDEKCFLFHLKSFHLFVLKIFKFLSCLYGHVGKAA